MATTTGQIYIGAVFNLVLQRKAHGLVISAREEVATRRGRRELHMNDLWQS